MVFLNASKRIILFQDNPKLGYIAIHRLLATVWKLDNYRQVPTRPARQVSSAWAFFICGEGGIRTPDRAFDPITV